MRSQQVLLSFCHFPTVFVPVRDSKGKSVYDSSGHCDSEGPAAELQTHMRPTLYVTGKSVAARQGSAVQHRVLSLQRLCPQHCAKAAEPKITRQTLHT